MVFRKNHLVYLLKKISLMTGAWLILQDICWVGMLFQHPTRSDQ